ncbi:MAG: hypothetical protein BWY70_01968 [Bacteroidetes bacterium ADurb.Bin408]|nr:MAG: hypothetical protein BWY70_01968 [Bacteroidetes bacterium ADurb.Bin408]
MYANEFINKTQKYGIGRCAVGINNVIGRYFQVVQRFAVCFLRVKTVSAERLKQRQALYAMAFGKVDTHYLVFPTVAAQRHKVAV